MVDDLVGCCHRSSEKHRKVEFRGGRCVVALNFEKEV